MLRFKIVLLDGVGFGLIPTERPVGRLVRVFHKHGFVRVAAIIGHKGEFLLQQAGNDLLPNMQNKFETYRKSMNIALSNILYYSFYKI